MEITGIRYINLAENWGRRMLMELMLRRSQRAPHRCPGVVYDPAERQFAGYRQRQCSPYLDSLDARRVKGILGCWIAHSRALKGVRDQHGVTVVLEDDFVCYRKFFDKALEMVRGFEHDFDVIVFAPDGCGPLQEHRIDYGTYDPKGVTHPYYHGTQCLFVNNASIPRILEAKARARVKDFDGFLFSPENDLRTYAMYTGLSGYLYMGSNVDDAPYEAGRLRLLQRWLGYYLN